MKTGKNRTRYRVGQVGFTTGTPVTNVRTGGHPMEGTEVRKAVGECTHYESSRDVKNCLFMTNVYVIGDTCNDTAAVKRP